MKRWKKGDSLQESHIQCPIDNYSWIAPTEIQVCYQLRLRYGKHKVHGYPRMKEHPALARSRVSMAH